MNGAAVDVNLLSFDTFIGLFNIDGTAYDGDRILRVDSVIFRRDGKGSVFNVDKSFAVFLVVGMKRIILRSDGDGTVFDADGIFAFQSFSCGGDIISSAGDLEIVFADDAIVVICIHV